jgi:hypothetical protein
MDTPELGAALLGIDLTSVNRTLAREPAYQSCPQYCLLLVGPEGKTHIWLILDGEKLYVDRNGNGDLTEPGEVFLSPDQAFTVGDITEAAGGARHTNFRVGMVPEVKPLKQPGYWSLTLDVEGRYRQYAFVHKPGTSPPGCPGRPFRRAAPDGNSCPREANPRSRG